MRIEFVPDPFYGPQGREWQGGDLAEVTRADLRWYYFLGGLRISDGGREIGPPWGWIPLFDLLCNLQQVLIFLSGGDALGIVDFTENAEKIEFSLKGDALTISPTYEADTLECHVGSFIAECERFLRAELVRVLNEYPNLARNVNVRELAMTLDVEIPPS